MVWSSHWIKTFVLSLVLFLSACSSKEDPPPQTEPAIPKYTVTVNIIDMNGTADTTGASLTLTTPNSDPEVEVINTISTDGAYSFKKLLADAAAFSLDIVSTDDRACIFDDPINDVHATGVISNNDIEFSVTCTNIPNYSLSGTISGLSESGQISRLIVLQTTVTRNNENFTLDEPNTGIRDNISFEIANNLRQGDIYKVTILSQPQLDICSIENDGGTVGIADIDNILITCIPREVPHYDIGGVANNIEADTTGVILLVDGGNDKVLRTNGSFLFGTPVPDGTYMVSVQDPSFPTQVCTFANGTNSTAITVSGEANNSLVLNCVTQTFAISGSISALVSNGLVITNSSNNEQATLVSNPPSYEFATPVKDGTYDLTIQNPSSPMQTCTFDSNSLPTVSVNVAGGNVSTASISCVTDQFRVLVDVLDVANLTGALGLDLVVNNIQQATLSIDSSTSVIPAPFSTPLDDLTNFTVNIVSQPDGLTCSFPNDLSSDTKQIVAADTTTGLISCMVTPTYAINGMMAGLMGTDSIDLQIDNPTATTSASGDGPSYVFNNRLNGTYNISITPLPADYDCSFPGGMTTAVVNVAGVNASADLITCKQKLTVVTAAIMDASLNGCLTDLTQTYVEEVTNLSCPNMGITDITGLDGLFNLSILDLSNNLLTVDDPVIPSAIPVLERLTSLTDLNLGNDVTLTNQNAIAQIPNIVGLTKLNLNNNTPASVMDLTNLTNLAVLSELYLDGNSLTEADLISIAARTLLTTLSISGNAFTGDISALAGISSLQTLLLKDNTAAMTMLSSLGGGTLSNIVSIDLSGNAATLCSEIQGLIDILNINNTNIVIPLIPQAPENCDGTQLPGDFTVGGSITTLIGGVATIPPGLPGTSTGLGLTLTYGSAPASTSTITVNGPADTFTFPAIPNGSVYAVTVTQQPSDSAPIPADRVEIFCSVEAGTGIGTVTDNNIADVKVNCTDDPLVADLAAFYAGPNMGIGGNIYNLCIVGKVSAQATVSQVGTSNDLVHPFGTTISSSTLDCNSRNISDLSGIEYLKQMTVFLIGSNVIADIGLKKIADSMPQLVVLNAPINQITNLPTTINTLTNLTRLVLNGNMISDVSLLENMPFPNPQIALNQNPSPVIPQVSLVLFNNAIVDVSPLATLTNLERIFLQNNQIGIILDKNNVRSLAALVKATTINLNDNPSMSCAELRDLLIALNGTTPVVEPALDPNIVGDFVASYCVPDIVIN